MFCERITPKKIGPLLLVTMVLATAYAHADDWPQWDGPNRNRKSTEVNLLKKWPEQGPELLWSVDGLGEGFSSVSIVNGTIYTTGKIEKQLVLFAIDTKGNHKWKRNCGPAWEKPHPGARTTPTFDNDKPREINPNTPLYYDDSIYVTTGHLGGIKLKLSEDGSKVELAWEDPNLDCYHGGVVLVDGNIYGSTYDGSWASIRWSDGKLNYKQKWLGKGAILYADGMLYCYEEKKGTFSLVTATSDSFDIVSLFEVKMGTAEHWAHPVICNGNLYIRHGDTLMAYDIKKQSPSAG